jgi:hypothetical protein
MRPKRRIIQLGLGFVEPPEEQIVELFDRRRCAEHSHEELVRVANLS